jgi:tight adherence protein B
MTALLGILEAGAAALLLAVAAGLLRDGRRRKAVAQRYGRLIGPVGRVGAPEARAQEAPEAEGRLDIIGLRAGLSPRFLLVVMPLAVGAVAVMAMLAMGIEAGLVAAGLGGLAAATMVSMRLRRREEAIHCELPPFIEAMRQQMLVGASLPQALQRAIGSGGPVMAEIFAPVERRVRHGGPLGETLEWAARRHGGPDLASLAAAVAASLRYGGSLSDALGNLASLVRARSRTAEEMRAASSEVRASVVVVAILPIFVAAWLFFTVPDYLSYFMETEGGQQTLAIVVALYITGLLLLRRLAQPRF